MAPAKRARPAFSPPRPGKSKTPTTKPSKPTAQRSRYISATESESDSQAESDEGDGTQTHDSTNLSDSLTNNRERERDQDTLENDKEGHPRASDAENDGDDSEPEYVLAEVSSSDAHPAIPLPLIHRIIHAHFAQADKTKISKDAREILGKYVEIFVREAIMRCAYEKTHAAEGGEPTVGGGWLEVDDLEKVAVQLCLDF